MNFFEEAGAPLAAIPDNQPSAPAVPLDAVPPSGLPEPRSVEPGHVPTWADTDKELPPFFEEPSIPGLTEPPAAEPTPAPAAAAAPQQPPAAPPQAIDPNAMAQAIVNGLLGAANAREAEAAFKQQTSTALALPPMDRERMLVDPEYFASYMGQFGEAVQRRTLAMVAPAFNQAAAMARIGPAVVQSSINTARTLGAQLAKERLGMDATRFNELVPVVHRMIDENPDPARRIEFLTSPDAWVVGADAASRLAQGGVPVTRTAPPPALSGGGAAPSNTPGNFRGKTQMMALVEQQLGRKLFDATDVDRVRRNMVLGGTKEASVA